jgi:hypothetical protein
VWHPPQYFRGYQENNRVPAGSALPVSGPGIIPHHTASLAQRTLWFKTAQVFNVLE